MTDEENKRPFDILNDMREGESVTITLKDGSKIVGDMIAFDKHINMALKDVQIHPTDKKGYYESKQFFQRGDSVKSIEPEGTNEVTE